MVVICLLCFLKGSFNPSDLLQTYRPSIRHSLSLIFLGHNGIFLTMVACPWLSYMYFITEKTSPLSQNCSSSVQLHGGHE